MKKFGFVLILISTALLCTVAQNKTTNLWNLQKNGGIQWNVSSEENHQDHIEMSGMQISSIVHYGVNEEGSLMLSKELIFPMLRFQPNKTHDHLSHKFSNEIQPHFKVNGVELKESPVSFYLNGLVKIASKTNTPIEIERILFPSSNKAAYFEIFKLKNTATIACDLEIIPINSEEKTNAEKSVYGEYTITVSTNKSGEHKILAGQEFEFAVIYSARKSVIDPYSFSPSYEKEKRQKMISEIQENLVLETPNDTIDREFAFAKIRGTESIYDTKGGLMHGPGGGSYYAAIWANDQAEYINPFFPFLGNLNGNESAINSFRHFARFMNPEFEPIPSSIISEGVSTWQGAKDRGDQAMIAYGASRFALAYGDKNTAIELWPLIEWSLEYLERKKSADGVIFSDSDELENRFESGDYNLATNSLAYGGLIAASNLATALDKTKEADIYKNRAAELETAIEKYFGANVQGFDTYQYYLGNDKLRAWICYPLNMGIYDRKEETMKALFSDFLWTGNGLLSESGTETFWDRSTLHAFKGLLAAGKTEPTIDYLAYYSSKRLLGDHVPYPVEAWPEGNQRHLSAESGLYCRVITEGLFGIEPTGFKTFKLSPKLPEGWDFMNLKKIRAFESSFDINVSKAKNYTKIEIFENGNLLQEIKWDGKTEIKIQLKESNNGNC